MAEGNMDIYYFSAIIRNINFLKLHKATFPFVELGTICYKDIIRMIFSVAIPL